MDAAVPAALPEAGARIGTACFAVLAALFVGLAAFAGASGVPSADASTPVVDDEEVVDLVPVTVEGVIDAWERRIGAAGLRQVRVADGIASTGSMPTLRSALGSIAGLVLQDGFGGFDPPRISARGSGLQSAPVGRGLLWTFDGLPLNAADGSFNSALVDPAIGERVSLHAGAIDPVAAGVALGGSLALQSSFAERRSHLAVAAGEHGYLRGAFSGGAAVGDGRFWLAGTVARSEGWREHNAQSRGVLAGGFSQSFGSDAPTLFVRIYAANPRFDVPGPLTLAALEQAPESISAVAAVDQPRRETDFARSACELQWGRGEVSRFSLEVAAQTTRDEFRQLRANGIARTDGEDYTLRASGWREMGAHLVNAGLSHLWGSRDQARFANVGGAAGSEFAVLDLDASTDTAWIEDRWKATERTSVIAMIAGARTKREAIGPAAASGAVRDTNLTARLAVEQRVGASTGLVLAVSRATEAPTFDDLLAVRGTAPSLALAWTPLRVQKADTVELSVRHGGKRLSVDVTSYAARWDGELLRLADATGAARGTVNAGRTRHLGVEAGLRWRIVDGVRPLELGLTHTWSDARFVDDAVNGDNRLGGLPPHVGRIELSSVPACGGFAVVGASWVGGRTFVDHANRLDYEGHLIAQARAGWRGGRGWTVFVAVDNAFDRRYVASAAGVLDVARNPAATSVFLPGTPRTWQAGLEWTW